LQALRILGAMSATVPTQVFSDKEPRLPDPANFRPSWWHNRDYGLFVANPFGRAAMKQGAGSRIEVKKGETFNMRFSVICYQAKE